MSKSKCKYFLLISVFILLLSCDKGDDVNPDYVGTWSAFEVVTEDGITLNIKDIMTFTKEGFSDLGQIYYASASKYIDFIKMNGTISVSGNIMNVKITEIGVSLIDMTGMPTGTIVTYKEGSSQYDKLLVQTGQPKSFKSEYVVLGNKMTIKTDSNNDGDYTDAYETTVYIKQ
jgi:hypothetical protein